MTARKQPIYGISYLRFSSRKQLRNSSYARQIEATEQYCRENGITLIERLEDLGISAWDGSNLDDTAALGGFLQRVEQGKVPRGSVLLCENLDRVSRANILDALELFIRILKKGIDIHTTMDGMKYSEKSVRENVTQLIISITILSRAGEESTTKSERVLKSWDRRRAKVRNNEFAKFPCPTWLKHDGKSYYAIPERAEKIKKIFELCAAGFGMYSIVSELERLKIKSFTKTGRWSPVYINEVLHNPAVIGTYALIDPPQKNYFPKIVDDELYYKALAQRKRNVNYSGPKGKKGVMLFTGLCKCGRCILSKDKNTVESGNMVKYYSKNKYGVEYHSITCANSKLKKCRPYRFTSWPRFQDSFLTFFKSPLFKSFVKDEKQEKDRTSEIEGKLVEVRNNIQRVARILAKTESTALETQLGLLEQEKTILEKELDAETIRVKSQASSIEAWKRYCKDLEKNLENDSFRMELRAFMRRIIARIVVDENAYTIIFKGEEDIERSGIRVYLDNDVFMVTDPEHSEVKEYRYSVPTSMKSSIGRVYQEIDRQDGKAAPKMKRPAANTPSSAKA